MGVVAQLATVDDKDLSAVLAATFRSQLVTVVVQNAPARQRAETLLAKQEFPMPDMLVCTMMLPSNAKAGNCPGFASAGERAHALQAAACRGSDSPLAMPLPHTAVISRTRAEGLALSASDWPRGCLGYAVNLMRPVHTGHRATVIASLFGGVLVFETLEDAVQYKEFVTLVSDRLRGSGAAAVGQWLARSCWACTCAAEAKRRHRDDRHAGWQTDPAKWCGQRQQLCGVTGGQCGHPVWQQRSGGPGGHHVCDEVALCVAVPGGIGHDIVGLPSGSQCGCPQNSAAAQAAEQVTLLEELVELLRRREEANGAAAAAQASMVPAFAPSTACLPSLVVPACSVRLRLAG